MSQEERKSEWAKEAFRLRRRVNLAWWYQELTIPLIALALIGGSIVIASRRFSWQLGTAFWVILGLLVIGAMAFAWNRAKKKWLTPAEAFVRLEADLELNNALSTAEAGHGSWPEIKESRQVVCWNFGQVAFPMLAALLFLLLGFLVPIAPAGEAAPENQPYTWGRLQAMVEELVENEIIQEDYAGELKKQLEELRSQKAAEWFSAASLEATDSLQQAHAREANRLERDLMQMEQALRKAGDPKATDEQRQQLQQQFQEALEGMRAGQMKPNKELLEKLAEAAKNGLKGLSQEQQQELEQRLREMAEGLNDGNGPPMPGEGDPMRGPGVGPDLFGEKSPDLELKKFERLDGEESDDQDPGDLLKLEELEHDLDLSQQGPKASGAAKSEGLGGDRVWKDALDPDEQKSLKSFFE
jgi:hypothetical protein